MYKSKLYRLTSQRYQLPFHIDATRRVITMPAQDIPMMEWPNGQWCFEANAYILELYQRGLSRKNRGGTLLTYAANISHLLRFCYSNQTNPADLTDNQFGLFVRSLQGERRAANPTVCARDANSVIAIGRNCLDFLACVGRLGHGGDHVGVTGNVMSVEKEYEVRREGSARGRGKLVRRYWHHRSFPTPDPKKARLPISSDSLQRLRDTVHRASGSLYQRKRRYTMLTLLEITGGRRSELAALTVDSVYQAAAMPEPLLKLMTAKKPGGREEFRYIPISRHDTVGLIEFIEKNRRGVVRSTCGLDQDDRYVFINERTGRKLQPNTITQEVAFLAKIAGITTSACPHMFRHRFITKMFVALIEQHKFQNPDTFRQALLDTEAIKQKIQQWTGHSRLRSLDIYINLAFEEALGLKKAYDIVHAKLATASAVAALGELRAGIEDDKSSRNVASTMNALDSLLRGLAADLKMDQAGSEETARVYREPLQSTDLPRDATVRRRSRTWPSGSS